VRAEKRQPPGALQKIRPQQQRQIGNLIERLASELDRELERRVCDDASYADRYRCGEIIDAGHDAAAAVIHQIAGDNIKAGSPQRPHDRAIPSGGLPQVPRQSAVLDRQQGGGCLAR